MKHPVVADRIDTNELNHQLKDVKICRISTVPFFIVSQLKGQVEYLRDIGMDVLLVSSEGPEWLMVNPGHGLSVKIINIPRSLKPWHDFIALIKLIHLFLIHRFDIVHSTTPKAGLLTAIAAFISRTPVRLHTFTGQPWVTLQGLMRWGSRSADKLIGVLNTKCYADSSSQAHFMIGEGVLSSRKIAVIGQGSLAGVDMARFNPDNWSMSVKQELKKSLSIEASSTILIFVGRISPDKGIGELITAFYELRSMNYDVDLLLVGPYDQDCGGKSSLDLNKAMQCPNIHYIGYTECPERYLAISDIFCLPSYREGFGTAVIEAAAMGLPTLGTTIYGLIDAVVDGETGILVSPRNDRALLAALKHLLDNPDEVTRMGQAARQRCFQHFDANQINKKVAEEYLNVLKFKRGLISEREDYFSK
jgi:glycosyltransferase involved in cell wall biosynthesis